MVSHVSKNWALDLIVDSPALLNTIVREAILVVMVSRKLDDDSLPLLNIKRKKKKVKCKNINMSIFLNNT